MFKLQFTTDNAAFEDSRGYEIVRILRRLADRIEQNIGYANSEEFDGIVIMDANGNRIGSVSDAVDLP